MWRESLRQLATRALAVWLAASGLAVAQPLPQSLPGPPAGAAGRALGLQPAAVFAEYTPLSANTELTRRLLSPLALAEVRSKLASSHEALPAQSIDLAAEKFTVYVPPRAPSSGYGLLVFISPWEEAPLPRDWSGVLDRYGVIFASAWNSGNDADVMGRREPLALLATWNLMQRYPVDRARVYIGGFSGGSRIALRVALAYPDLFRGALLNAGSDPLGAGPPTLPPKELFERFQDSSRIVYVTGELDTLHLSMDADSERSMKTWCVFDVTSQITLGAGHQIAGPAALSWALAALGKHAAPDPGRLRACRAGLGREVAGELARIQSLADSGRQAEAQKLLYEVDRRFGGLAAPQSLALQSSLAGAQCGGAGADCPAAAGQR